MIVEECATREFLRQLGTQLGTPAGIVCISAHWVTEEPLVTTNPLPSTVHDFYGFAEELYALSYPAPGDPALAERVLGLLAERGIPAGGDAARGFDHGAWAPLTLMYPEARVPMIQLSVQPTLGPEHHLAIGEALRPLREEGILILASGSATHNLNDFVGHKLGAEPMRYAQEFAWWLELAIAEGRTGDLLAYQYKGPHALRCHPTAEHFLPLFVPLGMGGKGRLIHDSYTYGALSMAAFAWE
jgi:4,5-DOPA dioxygenase extradiol